MLGYYWPSDNMSEGGSCALGDPGSLSHEDVHGWISGADDVHGVGSSVVKGFVCLFVFCRNLLEEHYNQILSLSFLKDLFFY